MPQLNEILKNKKAKKFKKKAYRPWDLSGEGQHSDNVPSIKSNPQHVSQQPEPSVEKPQSPLQLKTNTQTVENTQDLHTSQNTSSLDSTIDIKLDSGLDTIDTQLDSTKVTIRQQLDNNQISNRYQLDNNYSADSLISIVRKLSGVQGAIFHLIIDLCNVRGELSTGPIETTLLQTAANTTYGTTKSSISRLVSKGLVVRLRGKTAKGGYVNFAVTKEIKLAALEVKQDKGFLPQMNQLLSDIRKQIDSNLDDNPGIYSSNIITTKNKKKLLSNSLPDAWQQIDIEPLKDINFSMSHLRQLVDRSTPEVVQESIKHFAFGLQHKKEKYKKYTEPLNVFMGVLRKGQEWIESDYESPQDKALRTVLEEKKRQKEKREAIIKELIDENFLEWEKNLSKEEIQKIVPEPTYQTKMASAITNSLKCYYRDHVLVPKLKEEGVL